MLQKKRSVSMWQKKRSLFMWRKYEAFIKQLSSAQKLLHSSMCVAFYLPDDNSLLRSQHQEHNVDGLLAAEQ